ncbi:MAG: tRNA (adenosine(37)-N6)-threonylcarbamoyltransferase complex dimerization subunit type 1 TsaB [Candidatus Omnitrophica bacterium]|nr:tRNA (adenosine(37)-N6)-threonylcarbamoyltransferase complex dimerization subunit type 1 TsaB [Candidatus Omnitrophota bacterium]
MKLLSIETSTQMVSCALGDEKKRIFRFSRNKPRAASTLIGDIKRLMDTHRATFADIDAFVIGSGPGSFTGLRIGYSLVKGFSIGANKPVIELGSFLSIVTQLQSEYTRIAVVSDARRNLFYGASYRIANNKIVRVKKEGLYTPKEFIAHHSDYVFVTYDEHIRQFLNEQGRNLSVHRGCVWPDAEVLITLAGPLYNKKKYVKCDTLKPLYLYPKDCQVKRIK